MRNQFGETINPNAEPALAQPGCFQRSVGRPSPFPSGCDEREFQAALATSNCSAANMVPVESLRPLIKAIGVLLGCQHITVEDNERAIEINHAFNSALQKVRDESIAVAHLIYESTKQPNDRTEPGPDGKQ